MAPFRTQRSLSNKISEDSIINFIRNADLELGSYYALYSDELKPLCDFQAVPDDLKTNPLPNGDVALQMANGQEAVFDVIAVVVDSCLETPPGYAKSKFPFFRRWIKVTAIADPSFDAAVEACQLLCSFMSLCVDNVVPPPQFLASGVNCFRPSAEMLTSLKITPGATAVPIPTLEDPAPFEAAIQAGHGKFVFSKENEIFFFGDGPTATGDVIRREILPNTIRPGQIVQVRMTLRLFKQRDGSFTFRELLRGIYVIDDGISMDIARKMAGQALRKASRAGKDPKFYNVARKGEPSGSGKGGL